MPKNHQPPNTEFFARLNAIEKRLRHLEHQQNTTISNAKQQPVLNIGQIPPIGAQTQKTPLYGFQMLDPGTGNTGTPVIQLGQQADGTYGLEVFNPSGSLEVSLGEVPGSNNQIYALATYQNGVPYLVNAPLEIYTETTATVTSLTPFQLPGQNVNPLSFTVGPSGKFAFDISAAIALNPLANASVGLEVYLQYQVNGGAAVPSRTALLQISSGSSATGIYATVTGKDYINTAPNANVTASLWTAGTYMPSGATGYVYGAFATVTVY